MSKKQIYKVISIGLWVAAYAYLLYQLFNFDGYEQLVRGFRTTTPTQYICLSIAILLFPLNMLLEAWKWQFLLREIEPMSLFEAQYQVYQGLLGAFVTPYRVGDYPARILHMKDKSLFLNAIGMACIGSLALTMVIMLVGLPSALLFLFRKQAYIPMSVYLITFVSIAILFCLPPILRQLAHLPSKNTKVHALVQQLTHIHYRQWCTICWQSFLRYLCFCCQLWLVLFVCGIHLSLYYTLITIPLYYLLVTLTPNLPIVDPGIRGAWAIFVFGSILPNQQAPLALATTLLWLINTILPIITATLCKGLQRAHNK